MFHSPKAGLSQTVEGSSCLDNLKNRQIKANSPLHVSRAPKLCSIFTCSRTRCECVPKIQILRDHPRKQNKHRSSMNCFFWSILLTASKMRADKKNIDNWHSVYLTPLVLHHTLNRKKNKKQKIRKWGAHSGQSNTHKKTKKQKVRAKTRRKMVNMNL